MALRMTVKSLMGGQHVESPDLQSILVCEKTLRHAAALFATHMETTLTFDGREKMEQV